MSRSAVASVLVLGEDSSAQAGKVLETLIKHIFRDLDPGCDPERFRFEPANDDARKLLAANQWAGDKLGNDRYIARTRLHRLIAATLIRDDGFVLHHVDADRTWGERQRRPSVNAAHLEEHIVAHVGRELEVHYRGPPVPRRRARTTVERLSEAEIEARVGEHMSRFIRVIPHWEIEAWLYQHTDRATALCPGEPRCTRSPSCHDKLAAWRDDRGALDEVEHPSDQLCLGKRHNEALVRGFPTHEVLGAGKSFAALAHDMLGCTALLHALERTHETVFPPSEST